MRATAILLLLILLTHVVRAQGLPDPNPFTTATLAEALDLSIRTNRVLLGSPRPDLEVRLDAALGAAPSKP
jgi:hypothetical protein